MNPDASNRLHGRTIRVAAVVAGQNVRQEVLPPGSDVILGGGAGATLVVPGWSGPDFLLVGEGKWLALGPGMHMHACHDRGEDRVEATYEELVASGVQFPLRMTVSRYNLRIRDGLRVMMELRALTP
jgi:hypothetical protein